MKKHLLSGVLVAFFLTLLFSCKKEEFTSDPVSLQFSEDTIFFDTVFTTVGSATQVFSVYNTSDDAVKISSIRLATGESSNFRLNVDGQAGKSFSDIEIGGNDSIFIFVEVTVDPNNQLTPYVITDSILFNTNGIDQDLDLVAWGQDAYFHRPPPRSQIDPLFFADTVNQNFAWHNDKPHVVYGFAMIDSSQTLTIDAGTKIYFHPGSGLIALSSGSLVVNGTQTDPVVFQGDRLGYDYQDVPGQWYGIWLSNLNLRSEAISPGAKDCVIKYAIIKNGTIGIQVDSSFDGNLNNPSLQLENTIIKTMSVNSLRCIDSRVNAYNCVFANTGEQVANILIGGNYKFYHCTFANFWQYGTRTDPAVTLNNHYTSIEGPVTQTLDAYFGNCIIYGTNDNEIGYDSANASNRFNFTFDHVLIRAENSFPTSGSRYISIIKSFTGLNNPNFVDEENNDYQIDSTSSVAIDAGDINITNLFPTILNLDLAGDSRPQRAGPDLGAYERE